jgi:hypothetical protein
MKEEEELRGKVVAFTHMAQFAEAITIVTEDKGILVVEQEIDEDKDYDFSKQIRVYKEFRAKKYILEHKYLRAELNKLGIITEKDIKEYEDKLKEEREKRLLEEKKRKEERERFELERLKAKYPEQL